MSTVESRSTVASAKDDLAVELAVSLLVEYTEKARQWKERFQKIKQVASGKLRENNVPDYRNSRMFVRTVENEFLSLSQYVSHILEHNDLHPLDRINLKLKLEEFEFEVRPIVQAD